MTNLITLLSTLNLHIWNTSSVEQAVQTAPSSAVYVQQRGSLSPLLVMGRTARNSYAVSLSNGKISVANQQTFAVTTFKNTDEFQQWIANR